MTEPGSSERPGLGAIADGLWNRLRDVVLVAERIETFAFKPEDGPARVMLGPDDADELARDVVLRALQTAGDRLNDAIMRRTRGEDGASVEELAEALGVPRLVITERIAALMQVGLVQRALDSDRAFATVAGIALSDVIDEVSADLVARLSKARGRKPDGLPLL